MVFIKHDNKEQPFSKLPFPDTTKYAAFCWKLIGHGFELPPGLEITQVVAIWSGNHRDIWTTKRKKIHTMVRH